MNNFGNIFLVFVLFQISNKGFSHKLLVFIFNTSPTLNLFDFLNISLLLEVANLDFVPNFV